MRKLLLGASILILTIVCAWGLTPSAKVSHVNAASPSPIVPNYSWYNPSNNSFGIDTAGKLLAFSRLVGGFNDEINPFGWTAQSFAGKTVKLTANIDATGLDELVWDPIGYSDGEYNFPFAGTFDGDTYMVFNLNAGGETLFGHVTGTVINANVMNYATFAGMVNTALNGVTLPSSIDTVAKAEAQVIGLVGAQYTKAIGLVSHGFSPAVDGTKQTWQGTNGAYNFTALGVNYNLVVQATPFVGILGVQIQNKQLNTVLIGADQQFTAKVTRNDGGDTSGAGIVWQVVDHGTPKTAGTRMHPTINGLLEINTHETAAQVKVIATFMGPTIEQDEHDEIIITIERRAFPTAQLQMLKDNYFPDVEDVEVGGNMIMFPEVPQYYFTNNISGQEFNDILVIQYGISTTQNVANATWIDTRNLIVMGLESETRYFVYVRYVGSIVYGESAATFAFMVTTTAGAPRSPYTPPKEWLDYSTAVAISCVSCIVGTAVILFCVYWFYLRKNEKFNAKVKSILKRKPKAS